MGEDDGCVDVNREFAHEAVVGVGVCRRPGRRRGCRARRAGAGAEGLDDPGPDLIDGLAALDGAQVEQVGLVAGRRGELGRRLLPDGRNWNVLGCDRSPRMNRARWALMFCAATLWVRLLIARCVGRL